MTKPFQPSPFDSKLPSTPISIFSKMSQLAHEYGAINLSQGFPDFDVDPKLINLVDQKMQQGLNQYAPMIGAESLRQCISLKYKHINGLTVDCDKEITITAGGTQALFTAIGTLIHPGDEVILFEPAYDSYGPSISCFGGKIIPIRLYAPNFSIDWEVVEAAITVKTKLIIINNPNNPTGKVLSKYDIEQLEGIVAAHSLYVISDEVYEHIIYDAIEHVSVLQSPILRDRSYVVASFGKLLHATGWKVGYIIANPLLTAEFRKIHQFNVFSVNTPVQFAIAEYLQDVEYFHALSNMFEEKRNFLMNELKQTQFKILPTQGTYFMLLDYSEISIEEEMTFAEYLIKSFGVATVPVSAFYSNGVNQSLLRICFAKKEETLIKSVENLKKL